MKKYFVLVTLFFFSISICFAQNYDVLDEVKADVRKSSGMEGPFRFDGLKPLTKAPCGYKAFYISHYARHGSRYSSSSKTYTIIRDVLDKADKLGVLTPYGKELHKNYEAFYMVPWVNTGDLVPLGFEQHKKIGEFTANSFPEVFKGQKKVDAISSTAQRSIVSMSAFSLGLKGRCPKLDITLGSNHVGMTVAAPPSAPESLVRHFKGEDDAPAIESEESFRARISREKELLDKLFTDSSFLGDMKYGGRFAFELWQLYCGYHNYEERPLFDDLFTDDLRLAFWEAENYGSYIYEATARYSQIPLLEDIVQKAEAAFEDPNKAADLRFGHDYILEALAALLNLNGWGTAVSKPEEVKYWFQNYNVPMAATLMMVFYKNAKDDILFKVLLNEEEYSIPQLKAVKGPYYRWNDFLAWYDAMRAAHPENK